MNCEKCGAALDRVDVTYPAYVYASYSLDFDGSDVQINSEESEPTEKMEFACHACGMVVTDEQGEHLSELIF